MLVQQTQILSLLMTRQNSVLLGESIYWRHRTTGSIWIDVPLDMQRMKSIKTFERFEATYRNSQ